MFRLAFAGLATAEAATLAVTWSDCGAKHAKVTDLQPTSVHTGATETITGTGTVDEDVTSAHFTATVSALGAKLTDCDGDATSDIVCNLPMGVGKITVKAVPFPLKAGTVSIPVEVQTSSLIPASLANVDVHIAAVDQNGEDTICLDVHTAKQLEATGACSADDQGKLQDPQDVGKKANDCGTSSYNILTGNFNHDKFNSCFTASAGISSGCSECYAATGEYGAKNCKADCLLGWCKSGCLSCTAPAQDTLATCTGFTAGTAEPCEEEVKATVTGACSADDQGKLQDPEDVGKKANDCGTSSYNILTGNFNHDKFNSCFTASAGISSACSECYAATGEYGAKNCKADCLLGWCKSGCLSCTAPAQDTLATCTGFTAGTADPCEEEVKATVTAGACTADEQGKLADPKTVGDQANTCGTSSYNILTGNFNHDKFNSCFTSAMGISTQCSECYAVTGEYGAKNCKADCLLGWCKSGCLSCTTPAQATLATCTGFTAGTADPCEEETV